MTQNISKKTYKKRISKKFENHNLSLNRKKHELETGERF